MANLAWERPEISAILKWQRFDEDRYEDQFDGRAEGKTGGQSIESAGASTQGASASNSPEAY